MKYTRHRQESGYYLVRGAPIKGRKLAKTISILSLTAILLTPQTQSYANEGNASRGRQCSVVTEDLIKASTGAKAQEIASRVFSEEYTVWDHVGFTDIAWSGKQHVYLNKEGGLIFQGYAQMPYNDLVITDKPHEDKVIKFGQIPLRADWHTLNGNGLVFGAKLNGNTLSGFSVVATVNKIEVREYTNVTKESFMEGNAEFKVLASKPKICPAQEFIVDGKKVYESGKLLYEVTQPYYGNYVGAMSDFAEHSCGSLSTIYVPYLMIGEENLFGAKAGK